MKEMHLLAVVAERVWDAEFGNIHQSTLSIPGVVVKKEEQEQEEEEVNSWGRAGGGDQFPSLHISL